HLLLPRPPRMAPVLPVDGGPQHHRAGRRRPVRVRWAVHVGADRPHHPGRSVPRRTDPTLGGRARRVRRPGRPRPPPPRHRPLPRRPHPRGDRPGPLGRPPPAPAGLHLGPTVDVDLVGNGATLRWKRPDGTEGTAVATLPEALAWRVVRGATDPIEGWYSPGFGHKLPATTLVGSGKLSSAELRTELQFN